MRSSRVIVSVAVGTVLLGTGCATKKFVGEEVSKSEARVSQQVGKVESDLSQEKAQLQTVTSEVARVRVVATEATQKATEAGTKADEAGTRAGQAIARAEDATGKATQAAGRADEAAGRAEQATQRADEAAGKAGQALAKADETDTRLTRLWPKRNQRSLVETVTITFGFDKWELDDRAQTALLELVKQMQANANLIADLEGYTDNTGPGPYNVQLSQRRAEAVRRFLVEKGVDVHRIQSIGLGNARPVADNKTRQGRDQNRRVAVKLFAPTD
jgi:OOP family OmpA-OmpF porin